MDLQIGHQIRRNTVHPLLITISVITRFNDLGKTQTLLNFIFKIVTDATFLTLIGLKEWTTDTSKTQIKA